MTQAQLADRITKIYLRCCTEHEFLVNGKPNIHYYNIRKHFLTKPIGELEKLFEFCQEGKLKKGMTLTDLYNESAKFKQEKLWARDRTRVKKETEDDDWLSLVMEL